MKIECCGHDIEPFPYPDDVWWLHCPDCGKEVFEIGLEAALERWDEAVAV